MKKRLTAIISALLCLLFLFSCGSKEKNSPPPDDDPGGAVTDDPEKGNALPVKGSTPANEDGSVMKIDLSYLDEKGMTVDSVFAASSDIILVFASPINDGIVSERSYLFPYSVGKDSFTDASMPLGIIGQYPTTVFNDGTIMIMTLNTETYGTEKLLFINPSTLDYDEYDISILGDGVRTVIVSPDRRMAAVSNSTELYITDMAFETVYAVMEGYTPEGEDPDMDYRLPTAYGWLPDGSGVIGGLLGWEWVYNPILLTTDGRTRDLSQFEFLAATPYGSDMLIYDYFSLTPVGVAASDGTGYSELNISGLPGDEDNGYISALCACQDGGLIALGIADYSEGGVSRAEILRGDSPILTFSLDGGGAYGPDFESVSLSPSGKLAVMLTAATVDSQKEIYFAKIQ